MKKLLLLAILAISLMSCESQSGRRQRIESYPTIKQLTTYSVHVKAYLNDSVIAEQQYVVRNTKAYADSVIAIKVNEVAGHVICDSLKIDMVEAELVK